MFVNDVISEQEQNKYTWQEFQNVFCEGNEKVKIFEIPFICDSVGNYILPGLDK